MSRPASAPAPSSSRESVLDRLSDITDRLIEAHGELADLHTTNQQGRAQAWATASQSQLPGGKDSVSQRDRYADIAMLDIASEIIVLKGEMAALVEERDWCRLLLGLKDNGTLGQ